MANALRTEFPDFAGGQNDTLDATEIANNEFAKCRNVLWKKRRLETRKGYVLETTVKFEDKTNADIFSATTIGKNAWAVVNDEFNGYTVEIYGGTGSGQTRTIVDSEANGGNGRLTVAAWTVTPDATSDFRIYAPILLTYRYVIPDGTEILLAHTGGHVFKSTDGLTWTQIVILKNDGTTEMILTKTAQMSFVTYAGLCFFFNGIDNVWSYNGNGGAVMVYDRGVGGYGTLVGAASALGLTTTLIDTTHTEDNDYWNGFKMYFMQDNSANFDLSRVVTDWDKNTSTFTFAAVEATTKAGDDYYVGPNIPLAAYAVNCQNRIFAMMRSDANVHFCARDDYWYWGNRNYFTIEVSEGQRNTGLAAYQGYLVCFKERSVIRYDVSDVFPESWRHITVSERYGCAHNNSIQVMKLNGVDHLIWMSYEGFCVMGPDWQVHNITKDRFEREFGNLQLPTYNYLSWVQTSKADFDASAVLTNIDTATVSGEFAVAGSSKTWATEANFENSGTVFDGLKADNGYLEIDFPTGESTATMDQNTGSDSAAFNLLLAGTYQSISSTIPYFLDAIYFRMNKTAGATGTVTLTITSGVEGVAVVTKAVSALPTTTDWVGFAIPHKLIKADQFYHLSMALTGGTVGKAVNWWYESPGDYSAGVAGFDITADFLFKCYGVKAEGTWTSEPIDATYTNPVFGNFSVTISEMTVGSGVTCEIQTSASSSSWSDSNWREVKNGERIIPHGSLRYFKVRVRISSNGWDVSPRVDDIVVPYCSPTGTLDSAIYQQATTFDEWGTFEATQYVPTGAPHHGDCKIEWYYRTSAVSAADILNVGWTPITIGGKLTAPIVVPSWVQIRCYIVVYNASDKPTVQDFTVHWLDWTAGSSLTRLCHSIVWDDRYWIALAEADQTQNNMVIVIDERTAFWPMTIATNCFAKFHDMLYSGNSSAQILRMDYGYNDNGVAYESYAETKEIAPSGPAHKSIFRAIDLVLERLGTYNLSVSFCIDPQLERPTYTALKDISLAGAGTLMSRVNFKTSLKYTGRFVRLKLSTTAINNPWYVYSATLFSFPYGLQGARDAVTSTPALPPARNLD